MFFLEKRNSITPVVPKSGLEACIQRPGMRSDVPSFATLTTEGPAEVSDLMRELLLKMNVPEKDIAEIITIENTGDNETRPMDLSKADDVQHIIVASQRLQMGESIGFYLNGNATRGEIGKLNYMLNQDSTVPNPLDIALFDTEEGLLLVITSETPQECEARSQQEKLQSKRKCNAGEDVAMIFPDYSKMIAYAIYSSRE